MIRALLAFLACLFAISPGLAEDGNVFYSPTAGFEVTKPDEWLFMTAEEYLENLGHVELENEKFEELMVKHATTPLVAMTKYPEPFDDVNPSLKVNIRSFGELKTRDGKDVLDLALVLFPELYTDFVLAQEPMDTELSGMKAAYARMNYSLKAPDGRTFPTTSEIWIVPRGDYFFMIGTGYRQDEATGSQAEVHAILDTVRIEPR